MGTRKPGDGSRDGDSPGIGHGPPHLGLENGASSVDWTAVDVAHEESKIGGEVLCSGNCTLIAPQRGQRSGSMPVRRINRSRQPSVCVGGAR